MKKQMVVLLLFGWVLWFTQEESRPHLVMPSHYSVIGLFASESACNNYGQKLIEQFARVSPQKGYIRGTAANSMLDTRTDTKDNILHEIQTTLYCMPEDVDPRQSTKK